MRDGDFIVEPGVADAVLVALGTVERGRGFGNGRLARDIFEHMLRRQAVRLTAVVPSRDDLRTLLLDDLAWEAPTIRARSTPGDEAADE